MSSKHALQNPESLGRERHQTLTIALHWLTALMILVQISLAIIHEQMEGTNTGRAVLAAHRSLGVLIGFLIVGRLVWRLFGMRLPPFPANMPGWQQWGARISEWGLYGLLLAQPLTGMAATVLRGRPFRAFGFQVPSLMAQNKDWAFIAGQLHTLGAYALSGLVLLHAGSAILHRLIANDGVLNSMLPSQRKGSGPTTRRVAQSVSP